MLIEPTSKDRSVGGDPSPADVSRRDLLKVAAGAGAAFVLGGCGSPTEAGSAQASPLADPLYNSSAKALACAIREGRLTSVEVVDMYLARIEEVNPALNAVVQLRAEGARADARLADQRLASGEPVGPLHGVPMTIKDSYDTVGMISSWGTLGRANTMPDRDATVVRRLKDAGAILLGKTNTPEFTFGFEADNLVYGRTNSPWDLARSPGGSSGGCAAIVSAGGTAFSIGSDYTGSVRLPAHFCGLVGLKPTHGRVPRTGHAVAFGGLSDHYQQPGPLVRHVEDLHLLLRIMEGPDYVDPSIVPMPLGDPSDVDLGALRVAFYVDDGIKTPTSDIQATVRAAAAALEESGARVVESRPRGIERSYEVSQRLIAGDGLALFRRLIAAQGTDQLSISGYKTVSDLSVPPLVGVELDEALEQANSLRMEMSAFLTQHDLIICPVTSQAAFLHGASRDPTTDPGASYTEAFSLLGWPAATVRAGMSTEGFPIGVQIAAAPGRDDLVLAAAARLEESLGGFRAPPI